MKNVILFFPFCFCALTVSAEDWTLTKGSTWARQRDAVKMSAEKQNDKEIICIVHTGNEDWALSEGKRIPVSAGDIFELQARMQFEGNNHAGISAVTRGTDGETIEWIYAQKELTGKTPWTTLMSRFIVPSGVATIEPRITGYAPAKVEIDGFSLKKIESRPMVSPDAKPLILENRFLKVDVNPAGVFSVTDKRTQRVWKPANGIKNFIAVPKAQGENATFTLVNTENLLEFDVLLLLEPDSPELTVQIKGNGEMPGNVVYPPAFESERGDRLIIPLNEGIGYPVEEKNIGVGRLIAYGGHGICMAFWGQIKDTDGSGMTAILETPDDVSIDIRSGNSGLLCVNAVWEPSFKEFRYERSLRFVFLDRGGHVAVAKRYRDYAKQTGLLVPFSEKVKKNPNIDKLLGAVNIWYWDNDKINIVKELKANGIDRILWSGSGNAEQLAEMNQMENVLTSRYDIYQDVMDTAQFDKVWVHSDWTTEAWDKDINWTEPDGTWRRGWYVDQKDKTQPRIPCAVICDAKAVPYARKRITEELKTKPYKARFIDTTVAAPWFECRHPDHPMTRSDSKKYKMQLLELIGELGLVCGSETGHDASVPFCDFYEGMLSLGPYRVHESGRDMIQLVDEVPSQIERFQVNPVLRLPLWELVYHDCVVAQWYWGDYNNKLPKVWRKRDLFNALYGTPPMYMFTKKYWVENKNRFAESYKTAAGTARKTAYAEMTDHRLLSSDRLVQQTVFSNGTKVTVNFGEKPFTLPDGSVLNGLDGKTE